MKKPLASGSRAQRLTTETIANALGRRKGRGGWVARCPVVAREAPQ